MALDLADMAIAVKIVSHDPAPKIAPTDSACKEKEDLCSGKPQFGSKGRPRDRVGLELRFLIRRSSNEKNFGERSLRLVGV